MKRNTIQLLLINLGIIAMVFIGFFYMKGNSQIVYVEPIVIDVKQEPDAFAPAITQIHQNDKITITDEKDDWFFIQTEQKITGWVPTWLLFDATSGPYTNLAAQITERDVKLMPQNNSSGEVLTTLKKNQTVTVTLELDDWVRIDTGKMYGWIPSKDVSIKKKLNNTYTEKEKLKVAVETANLLSDETQSSEAISVLEYGQEVTFISQIDNQFIKVEDKQGQQGFLSTWEVTTRKISQDEDRPTAPHPDFIVMLDPGHGGDDSGAQTLDGAVLEKNLTLTTAQTVKNLLQKNGYTVLMTRDSDVLVPLKNIAKLSSENQTNAFISMHYDSSGTANEGSGTTTFYYGENSKELAQDINDSLATFLPLDNRGFAKEDYLILRENTRPAVLLELGYINNELDATYAQSQDYYNEVAKAINDALEVYISSNLKK